MPLNTIEWPSESIRAQEFAVAKEMLCESGQISPNGTKLLRKESGLSHSFIIVGGRLLAMSGKGIYLGKGVEGKVKIAEDEAGGRYALKIITEDIPTPLPSENKIAVDLGKALGGGSRHSRGGYKHYIPYYYLGRTIRDYLREKKSVRDFSIDQRFDLAIKLMWALHGLHSGKHSLSGVSYLHNDLYDTNMTIDEAGEIHFIDYGRARSVGRDKNIQIFSRGSKISELEQKGVDVKNLMNIIYGYSEWPLGRVSIGFLGDDVSAVTRYMERGMLTALQALCEVSKEPPSALEICKKLTLIRMNLNTTLLYDTHFTHLETEAMIQSLNRLSFKIIPVVQIFQKAKSKFEKHQAQLTALEENYKNILVAYAEGKQEDVVILIRDFTDCSKTLVDRHVLNETSINTFMSLFDELLEEGPSLTGNVVCSLL